MKLALLLLLLPSSLTAQYKQTVTFVNSLDSLQRTITLQPFEDINRYDWHYLPATMIPRNGIALKVLDSTQKIKFYGMLKEFLSDHGVSRTHEIMSYEYLLKELQPENPTRIPDNFFITIYGDPAMDNNWGWKFSGHHVALNFTIVNNQVAFAPFFFGVAPSIVKEGRKKGNRIIKDEEDLGLQLIHSLSIDQKKKAVFQTESFYDIVTTNSAQTAPLREVGIAALELTMEQKLILNKLIVAYLSSMPEQIANIRMERVVKEDMDTITFGWAGGFESTVAHYYRIQGKTFMIEFDNIQGNHIHTVWRDFNGDFGFDLLREHYQNVKHKH